MISVEVRGLDEALAAVQALPATMGLGAAFESAGQRMSAILREQTPPGYNKKLADSVRYEASESGLVVGYEQGVDTAGGTQASVTRPRTSGRTVLSRRRRWVSVDELETVLEESWDSHADEILSIIERGVASGVS